MALLFAAVLAGLFAWSLSGGGERVGVDGESNETPGARETHEASPRDREASVAARRAIAPVGETSESTEGTDGGEGWAAILLARVVDPWGGARGDVVVEIEGAGEPERHRFPVPADGLFRAEVAGTGRVLLTVMEGPQALSPRVELTPEVRSKSVVDLGTILIGRPVALEVVVGDATSGERVYPAALWIIGQSQDRGTRGFVGEPGHGVFSRAIPVPMRVGEVRVDGRAVVDVPESICGGAIVAIAKGGMGRARLGSTGVLGRGDPEYVSIRPWKEYRIQVSSEGNPVPNAEVRVASFFATTLYHSRIGSTSELESRAVPLLAATTDEHGEARFRSVPYEKDLHVFARRGGRWERGRVAESGAGNVEFQRRVAIGERRLRFVDEDDRRIRGVRALLNNFVISADPSGDFLLPAGADYPSWSELKAECEGFVPYRSTLPKGSEPELEIELKRAAPLYVTVVDQYGAPVEGAAVRLSGDNRRDSETLTDARGIARLEHTPVLGERRVAVTPPAPRVGWNTNAPPSDHHVSVGAAAITVVLKRSELPVHSFLVRAVDINTGAALPMERLAFSTVGGSRVEPPPAGGILLGNESAFVESIPAGSYLVWAQAMNGSIGMTHTDVPPPAGVVECLVGPPIHRIEGVVLSDSDGRALDSILVGALVAGLGSVEARSPTKRVWPPLQKTKCDDRGRFTFEGLMPTQYELHVLWPFSSTQSVLVDTITDSGGLTEIRWEP